MLGAHLTAAAEWAAALARLTDHWGDPILVRNQAYALADCEIFVAGEFAGVAAVSCRDAPVAELVAINAFERGHGIGTALLAAITEHLRGFTILRVATTNDNLTALRFYQRRGFRLCNVRFGAIDVSRRLKPSIPLTGEHDIPIHDEIDLMLDLAGRSAA